MLLAADLDAADRDAVAGYVKRSHELRSWLDSFQVRCVRRTNELAEQGRTKPAESLITHEGSQSSRDSRQVRQRAVVCDLFALFEAALAAGEIAAGHVDALACAVRDLNDEQRFGLIDQEERLLATARTMRVDDFARHARAQAAEVVAELAKAARAAAAAAVSAARPETTAMTRAMTRVTSAGDGDTPCPRRLVDPAVVEYERQRAASKMRRWRDAESGLCMTLLALDPIRDAVLKTAYDRHLNTLRASGVHQRPALAASRSRRHAPRHHPRCHDDRGSRIDRPATVPAPRRVEPARTAANRPSSQLPGRVRDGAGDLRRDHHRHDPRRLLHPRNLRNQ